MKLSLKSLFLATVMGFITFTQANVSSSDVKEMLGGLFFREIDFSNNFIRGGKEVAISLEGDRIIKGDAALSSIDWNTAPKFTIHKKTIEEDKIQYWLISEGKEVTLSNALAICHFVPHQLEDTSSLKLRTKEGDDVTFYKVAVRGRRFVDTCFPIIVNN